MTISAKFRRHIVVDGESFLWWVKEDIEDDFVGTLTLNVASKDRRLLVCYGLVQADEGRYVVVLGPRFRSVRGTNSGWRRFACPSFAKPDLVTPKDVSEFVRWCTDEQGAVTELNHQDLPLGSSDSSAPRP